MSPIPIAGKGCCIEIMTGAALHHSADTVIRYEDIEINDKTVTLMDVVVKRGQNVHLRGKDRKEGEVIVDSNRVITPPVMGLAASIGKLELLVKRLPRVIIVTTGDEMVRAEAEPAPYQLRRSNGIVLKAGLVRYAIQADLVHLKIGRASCRERVCQYVRISGVAGSLKK